MTSLECVHSLNGWLCLRQHIWVFHYSIFIDFLWPNKSVHIHEQYGYGKIIFSYSYMNNILLKIGNIWLWIVIERQIHKPLSYTRCGSMLALCLVVPKRNRKERLCKTGWSLGCHRHKDHYSPCTQCFCKFLSIDLLSYMFTDHFSAVLPHFETPKQFFSDYYKKTTF